MSAHEGTVRRVLLAVLVVAGVFSSTVAARALTSSDPSPALAASPSRPATSAAGVACGKDDLPETGIQGDVPRIDQLDGRAQKGYNCGVDLVGYTSLGGRGGNANMAWSGNCAYVAGSGDGVAVVDVSDPRHPKQTATLEDSASSLAIETISAFTGPGRAVLVAGRYGPAPVPIPAPMDIWDVRDCAHPKLITTYTWPNNIHNLTFSPDGRRLYATLPLEAIDITDLAHPKYLGDLDNQIPQVNGLPFAKYLAHEVETSPDGNLLYLGGQTPQFQTFTIVDVSHWPAKPPVVLSQVTGRGHDIRLATINGRTYVLHSEESIVDPFAKGCVSEYLNPFAGPAQPWLSDVTDPRHPIMRISQFTLAINDKQNCAQQVLDQVNASVHYHDVDNPAHTTFAMLSMWNAGLRIADLRDPYHPTEVAYFNPGQMKSTIAGTTALDQAWGHIRYLPQTGQIWFATETGGFWVVELEPQVRKYLGLPSVPSLHPQGAPARPKSTINATYDYRPDTAEYYCIIGAL